MDITLHIQNLKFVVNKNLLIQHSDYFQAMFSGNFIENEKTDINIDVINANSMEIIIKYITNGLIDLFEFTPATLCELASSAHFLQMSELLKQIEYTLYSKMDENNWMDIVNASDNPAFTVIERQRFIAFGLFAFDKIKPEHIPDINKLYWYLSHPDLIVESETKILEFGVKWINLNNMSYDALLIILSCIDYTEIIKQDLKDMQTLIKEFDSLALKIVDCMHEALVLENNNYKPFLSEEILDKWNKKLKEKFTDRVYSETLLLVKESIKRHENITPCLSIIFDCQMKDDNNNVLKMVMKNDTYVYEKLIEVSQGALWGWGVTNWGYHRLVITGGEYGRGTGIFNRDIQVFDTLRKEFSKHGTLIPEHRHAGLAVIDNELFIVGGVGKYRKLLNSTIVYDLVHNTYRKSAEFPDAIQKPCTCVYNGKLYAGGHESIYRLNIGKDYDTWEFIIDGEMRFCCIAPFNNFIFGSQSYYTGLHKFWPNPEELIIQIPNVTRVKAMCNIGKRLLTIQETGSVYTKIREEPWAFEVNFIDKEDMGSKRIDILEKRPYSEIAACCTAVLELPSLNSNVSSYAKKYLNLFKDVKTNNC